MGKRILTLDDIDLLEQWWIEKSRTSFLAFRKYVNEPNFKCNWFVQSLCRDFQQFYTEFINGLRPVLICSAPPQHGKSVAVVDFIAWMLGMCSEIKEGIGRQLEVILTAYSDNLSKEANHDLQKVLLTRKYQLIFPKVKLPPRSNRTNVITSNLIEFECNKLKFTNTTIGGQITGQTLDFCIIDDPIKSIEKAYNQNNRDNLWRHILADVLSRFTEYACLLMTLTSWHIDDPAHRLIKIMPKAKWIKYKAIAEEDEKYRKEGDALFPELKSKEFLLIRKKTYLPEYWSAMYQQNAVVTGGNQFKLDYFQWWVHLPQLSYKFIVGDTAQKKGSRNDYTDFQCWGKGVDGNIYLLDHFRKRLSAPELRKEAIAFWNKHNTKRVNATDPMLRKFSIEDKSSGVGLIQELKLKKLNIGIIKRSTDKEFRANDVIPIIESGKVFLNKNIRDIDVIETEAVQFPNGAFDDSIDNLMNAVEVTYINDNGYDDLIAYYEAN